MCHTLICFTCLCDCLHSTISRCHPYSPLSPVYLYLCSLLDCCQFVLFVRVNQRFVSQLLLFPGKSNALHRIVMFYWWRPTPIPKVKWGDVLYCVVTVTMVPKDLTNVVVTIYSWVFLWRGRGVFEVRQQLTSCCLSCPLRTTTMLELWPCGVRIHLLPSYF